jgi:hypothetical protein
VDIAKIRREDIEIIDYLKANKSALLKQLRQECRAALKNSAKPV